METFAHTRGPGGRWRVTTALRGQALLRQPMLNKGTAFSAAEREAFGLLGLLPAAVSTQAQQAQRAFENVMRKPEPLERYIGLAALQDRNEHLFYRVVLEHIDELAPIVYTPTVGRACQEYSHIFRRARGLWITPEHRGRIAHVLGAAPWDDVRLIVATDNERILGLGDQGAGGMGIPIGKLVLYTIAAGIHPTQTLPLSLDVGTDNRALLDDDLYLGWRQPRLRGEAYASLVDELVHAVRERFPRALFQWEDFKKQNAFTLLDRYRKALPSFNDDIQGTAAVTLTAILAAGRATGTPLERQRIVILGAGAAGVGIARQLRDALRRAGLAGRDLARAVALLDSRGLLVEGQVHEEAYKAEFTWPADLAAEAGLGGEAGRTLLGVVQALRPTVLVGTSGTAGVFDERVVRAVAAATPRPAIFPLSNPTSKSEATAEDLLRWTGGQALVATGSPFDPVSVGGRTVRVSQANNVYIFPGVGLGTLVAGAREVTDSMFTAAALTLSSLLAAEDVDAGSLLPRLHELRHLTARIAAAVAVEAAHAGVAPPLDADEAARRVADAMWTPEYPELVPA